MDFGVIGNRKGANRNTSSEFGWKRMDHFVWNRDNTVLSFFTKQDSVVFDSNDGRSGTVRKTVCINGHLEGFVGGRRRRHHRVVSQIDSQKHLC